MRIETVLETSKDRGIVALRTLRRTASGRKSRSRPLQRLADAVRRTYTSGELPPTEQKGSRRATDATANNYRFANRGSLSAGNRWDCLFYFWRSEMSEERNPPAVTIRLRQEIADQIERLARQDGLTPTAFCRQAIHRQVNATRRQSDKGAATLVRRG